MKYGRLPTEVDPDYLEMLRMSKYRILAVPDFKPGKCANCGASKNDGRKYVDFGLEVDFYGTVYICGTCVTDIASNMGLFNQLRDEVASLHMKLLKIRQDSVNGVELKDEFLRIFKEVQDYIASLPAISDSSDADSGTVVDESKEPEHQRTTATVEQSTDGTKPSSTKQTTGSGSKNVPSLAKLLETTG